MPLREGRCGPLLLAVLLILSIAGARAAEPPPSAAPHYAPYAFLIGEWNVSPAEGAAVGVARFRFAGEEAYIWHSMSFLAGGAERLHYEGMLTWNGVHRNLDMLISLDGGRATELGTLSLQEDGTVVREITAYAAAPPAASTGGGEPGVGHFRQTFRAAGADRVLTAVLRRTADGWVPTFPGSDRLVMTRRPVS
jgi:hypothetical protein